MATRPPTLYAYPLEWPPSGKPDAAHYWVLDWDNEKVVEVENEPHVLVPLKKIYEDPYGLTERIPRRLIEDGGCPLCRSISVSHSSSKRITLTVVQHVCVLINALTFLVVFRRINLPRPPSLLQKEA